MNESEIKDLVLKGQRRQKIAIFITLLCSGLLAVAPAVSIFIFPETLGSESEKNKAMIISIVFSAITIFIIIAARKISKKSPYKMIFENSDKIVEVTGQLIRMRRGVSRLSNIHLITETGKRSMIMVESNKLDYYVEEIKKYLNTK